MHLVTFVRAAEHLIRGTVAAGRAASDDDRSSDSGRSVSSCSLGKQRYMTCIAYITLCRHYSWTLVLPACASVCRIKGKVAV